MTRSPHRHCTRLGRACSIHATRPQHALLCCRVPTGPLQAARAGNVPQVQHAAAAPTCLQPITRGTMTEGSTACAASSTMTTSKCFDSRWNMAEPAGRGGGHRGTAAHSEEAGGLLWRTVGLHTVLMVSVDEQACWGHVPTPCTCCTPACEPPSGAVPPLKQASSLNRAQLGRIVAWMQSACAACTSTAQCSPLLTCKAECAGHNHSLLQDGQLGALTQQPRHLGTATARAETQHNTTHLLNMHGLLHSKLHASSPRPVHAMHTAGS